MGECLSGACFISVDGLRDQIRRTAEQLHLTQTQAALAFAEQCHRGQYRKGPAGLPYIIHPMTVAVQAISFGFTDDTMLAAALLHDVCEDCGVAPEALPVGSEAREIVRLLTFTILPDETKTEAKKRYFGAISENRTASLIKIMDRCNNVSDMVCGFSRRKLREYIAETKTYVIPLLQKEKERSPELRSALFLVQYQICSVVNSVEILLNRTEPAAAISVRADDVSGLSVLSG